MPRPAPPEWALKAREAAKTCATCGGSPTLYRAVDKYFCKAHKDDASAAMPRGGFRDNEFNARSYANTHRFDQRRGITRVK